MDIAFTDNIVPRTYPFVQFLVIGLEEDTERDVFIYDFKAWILTFEITVAVRSDHVGGRDVVLSVYDLLMAQKTGKLSGNCQDIDISKIDFGLVATGKIDNPEIMNGGVITLKLKIFEQR